MVKKLKACFFLFVILFSLFFQFSLVESRSSRSYDSLIEAFLGLEGDYPDLMTHETVGKTVEGRDILMFKIGNVFGERIVFDGAIHGWENIGSELLYLYAHWLLTSSDSVAEDILDNSYTLLVPALNIDSYNETRKNSNGVDLNRNFKSGWDRSGSDDPSSEYYHGSSPLSEPESKALIWVFEKYRPKFYVNLHEGGTYYAGSLFGNRTYYGEIVDKVKNFAQETGVHPYFYQGEFRGSGLSISDAAILGINSFIIELHDPHIPDDIELDLFPRFKAIAIILGLECSVIGDLESPVTVCSYDDIWRNNDFMIFLSASDNKIGVLDTYYRINGGVVNAVSEDDQPFFSFEGATNVLEYWSVDLLGNEEIHGFVYGIKLDKTAPVVFDLSNLTNVDYGQEIECIFNVSDSLSGLSQVNFSYNVYGQSNWIYLPVSFNSTLNQFSVLIPPQNEGTAIRYKIQAIDNAGNSVVKNFDLEFSNTPIPEFSDLFLFLIFIVISLIIASLKKFLF